MSQIYMLLIDTCLRAGVCASVGVWMRGGGGGRDGGREGRREAGKQGEREGWRTEATAQQLGAHMSSEAG